MNKKKVFAGPANDGNVYNPSNTTAFVNYVLSSSDNRGVHLLMADGVCFCSYNLELAANFVYKLYSYVL